MPLSCQLVSADVHREVATVAFSCNGASVEVTVDRDASLLAVLREELALTSVKDGCAPQGQCGCCTVLIDGDARVACVTPITRVQGRSVTTVEGLDGPTRDALADGFVGTGGSQCGFCTPGIVLRAAALLAKSGDRGVGRAEVDRAMAAHLCRCTGWRSIEEAVVSISAPEGSKRPTPLARATDAAARAALEGGVEQQVGPEVPLGAGGFADDTAPRDALVAVPLPPGSSAPSVTAAGQEWVLGESLAEARRVAGKVQGRRTTRIEGPPLALPVRTGPGVRLATSWVEPAYLEPDASWCLPGGTPASPLANGGAFGGKVASPAPSAARELADRLGRPVRVVFAREDVVRLGPKRPPISAEAAFADGILRVVGTVVGEAPAGELALPYRVDGIVEEWTPTSVIGPPVSSALRAFPLAERTVLAEGALSEAGVDRANLIADERVAGVALDAMALDAGGAVAGARVLLDEGGVLDRVEIRVGAGDPLDDVVLRSYCMGAAHMALGWVLSESLAVDPGTGEVLDLTIRSFGVIRAKDTPALDVAIVDDDGPALPRASDAVFAAVAAAAWNAVAAAEGTRPESFPARETRAARRLRR